jgi:tight adherence protein C
MSAAVIAGAGAIGLAIATLVLVALPARASSRGASAAVQAIERRYGQHRSADPGLALGRPAVWQGWLRDLASRLSPTTSGGLQHRLDLAGNPARWTPDRFLAVKGLGLVALAVLGALSGLHSPALLVLFVAIGAAIGFFLPDLLLYNAGTKRQEKIRLALPDALDMLTVCVEAGLGFDAALAQVARNTTGPLAAEFARALQEMQIGKSRADALRATAERSSAPELRAFVSALVQASELGVPVAAVLREQAKEMRLKRRQHAEERAQKVPVKILFPLILCLFPGMFVVIIGPGAIRIAQSLFGH